MDISTPLTLTIQKEAPMALPWAAAAGVAGSLVSAYGASKQNKDNRKMAREQMAFQERMSNSAYQRSMADMKKAGLNPMLAYSKGGASSPGGATANMVNTLEPAVSTAMQTMRLNQDIKNLKAQENKTNAETDLINYQLPEAQATAEFYTNTGNSAKTLEKIKTSTGLDTRTLLQIWKAFSGSKR